MQELCHRVLLLFQNDEHFPGLPFHQIVELMHRLGIEGTCLLNDQRAACQAFDDRIQILVVELIGIDNGDTALLEIPVFLQSLDDVDSQHRLTGSLVSDDQDVAGAGSTVAVRALRVIFQNGHDLLAHALYRDEIGEQFLLFLCQTGL